MRFYYYDWNVELLKMTFKYLVYVLLKKSFRD